MRRQNTGEMTIVEQLQVIKDEVCDYACTYKWDLQVKYQNEPELVKVQLQQYCQNCPLNKLCITRKE